MNYTLRQISCTIVYQTVTKDQKLPTSLAYELLQRLDIPIVPNESLHFVK